MHLHPVALNYLIRVPIFVLHTQNKTFLRIENDLLSVYYKLSVAAT
jgi:hypothetical protein